MSICRALLRVYCDANIVIPKTIIFRAFVHLNVIYHAILASFNWIRLYNLKIDVSYIYQAYNINNRMEFLLYKQL